MSPSSIMVMICCVSPSFVTTPSLPQTDQTKTSVWKVCWGRFALQSRDIPLSNECSPLARYEKSFTSPLTPRCIVATVRHDHNGLDIN
jgi:hypothetical protein